MHVIEAESIYRPAILIPCLERSYNFGHTFVNQPARGPGIRSTNCVRMWGIPYKIRDRTGYNLTHLTSIGEHREPPFFIGDDAIQELYNESEDILPLQGGMLPENDLREGENEAET
jgi:hypothetical protein